MRVLRVKGSLEEIRLVKDKDGTHAYKARPFSVVPPITSSLHHLSCSTLDAHTYQHTLYQLTTTPPSCLLIVTLLPPYPLRSSITFIGLQPSNLSTPLVITSVATSVILPIPWQKMSFIGPTPIGGTMTTLGISSCSTWFKRTRGLPERSWSVFEDRTSLGVC